MDTRWLIPSNATDIKPEIEAKEGFAICFDTANKVWALIEDHRGEKFYSKETGRLVEIKTVGEIPNKLTHLPKPDLLSYLVRNVIKLGNYARQTSIKRYCRS